MNIKHLASLIGATLGAAALALSPTAAQAAGSLVAVGASGDTSNTSHSVGGYLKSASVSINLLGSPTTLGCTSGTVGGTIAGGTTGAGTNASHRFSTLSLDCDSLVSGSSVSMDVKSGCTVDFVGSSTVTSAKTDLVSGLVKMTQGSTNCVTVNTGTGCTLEVGGSTTATLNENKKNVAGVDYNELTLSGSGLQVRNPSFLCFGLVSHGDPFTINAVFNLDKQVNFLP